MLRTVPTIAKLLTDFLDEERKRLADSTFRKYEDVVELFRIYLDGYGHRALTAEEQRWMEERPDRKFTQSFGAAHIYPQYDEFLGWFLPRKTMSGKGRLRAAGTVLKRLAKWLGERGLADREAVRDAVEQAADGARVQLEAEDLAIKLNDAGDPSRWFEDAVEDRFEFVRIEGRDVWVEDLGGDAYGPIRLPPALAADCRLGWSFSGSIALAEGRWVLAEVGSVDPGP